MNMIIGVIGITALLLVAVMYIVDRITRNIGARIGQMMFEWIFENLSEDGRREWLEEGERLVAKQKKGKS